MTPLNRRFSAMALLAICTAALADGETGPQIGPGQRLSFEQLDSNGDGMLQLNEIQGKAPLIEHNFLQIDANHDGQLSKDELRNLRSELPMARDLVARRFQAADSDHDGVLSREEVKKTLPWVYQQFSTLDKNADGVLNREEMEQALQERNRLNGGHPIDGARGSAPTR